MKDSQALYDYHRTLAKMLDERRLARYGVTCPECQARVLLPWSDYLCANCRQDANASVLQQDVSDVRRAPTAANALPGL